MGYGIPISLALLALSQPLVDMPGVPLDAFTQVKKGLRIIFKKRKTAQQNQTAEENQPPATETTNTAPTTTAAPAPQEAPTPITADQAPKLDGIAKTDDITFEKEAVEPVQPVKIPMADCTRGQEADFHTATTNGQYDPYDLTE